MSSRKAILTLVAVIPFLAAGQIAVEVIHIAPRNGGAYNSGAVMRYVSGNGGAGKALPVCVCECSWACDDTGKLTLAARLIFEHSFFYPR